MPLAPTTLEDAGLSAELLTQLVLKTLHFSGELTGTELAQRLGPAFSGHRAGPRVPDQAAASRRDRRRRAALAAPRTGTASRTPAARAPCCSSGANHYVGVAPVPLEQYRAYMAALQARCAAPHATRDRVREAFSHLVLSDRVLDQLGPAINAGHSMFVYGPPGNGKTVISQAIRNLLDGEICDPARARGRGQHHPVLRSGQSRAAADRRH